MHTKRMNRRLCFWNPASPTTTSRLIPNCRYRCGVLLLALLLPAPALAGPAGEQVIAGSVTVNRPDAVTTLINQQTQKAIIDWQNFAIDRAETVRFQQPGADSIALNRVLGNDPSWIYGNLTANGQVFLVNPSGVLFSPDSQVSVQGLLATTHDIDNDDFLAGSYLFIRRQDLPVIGEVVNQGTLQAGENGYIVLAGDYAANSGVIQARLGQVALASGNRFTLDLDGDQLIGLAVDEASLAARAGVENFGTLAADGGQVLMTAKVAGELVPTVVNNEGLVQARSIEEENGAILLDGGPTGIVANSGTLDATGLKAGESGGSVRLLGQKVGLLGHGLVDVSGASGGGTALIGGDYQGKNPEIRNATNTYLGSEAVVKADATGNGDGGRVIVWADEVTGAYGGISAQGGQFGGDGGFVEVSGKQFLDYHARTDTTSLYGLTGTLLLDPASIVIVAGTGDGSIMGVGTNTNDFIGYPGATSGTITVADTGPTTVYESEIEGQSVTTNIILQATDGISTSGTFLSPILLASNRNLTLQTRNDAGDAATGINISSAEFQTQGSGTITIETGMVGAAAPQAAPITVGKLTTAGGNVIIDSSGALTLQDTVYAGPGTATLAAGAGGITQSGGIITAGALKVNSAGNVTLSGLNQVATIAADLTGPASSFIYESAGGFSIGNVGGTFGVTTNNGNITMRGYAGTPIQIAEDVSAGTGNILIGQAAVGPGGDIGVAATKTVSGNNVQLYASDAGGILNINGSVNGTGSVFLDTPGIISIASTGMISGPSLNLSADTMDLQGSIEAVAGLAWLHPHTVGQDIDLGDADSAGTLGLTDAELDTVLTDTLRVGAVTAGDLNVSSAIGPAGTSTLSLEAGGTITQASPGIISTTNLALKALGDVTLDTAANQVTNLAASIGDGTHLNHNLTFKNAGSLNIDIIDGRIGIGTAIDANNFDSASPNGVISLISGVGLTQSAGALLAGKAVYAEGSSVVLTQANPTGVLAGKSTGSLAAQLFNYTSSSGIHLTTVNGFSGIQSNSTEPAGVLLAASSAGIGQDADAPIINSGAGLLLNTTGPVDLDAAANDVGALATVVNTGHLYFNDIDALTLDITGNGISTTATNPIKITAVGVTNNGTVSGPGGVFIDAGTGLLNNTGGTITTNGTASPINLVADTMTLTGGTIATSDAVGLDLSTIINTITVGATGAYLSILPSDLQSITAARGVGIGGTANADQSMIWGTSAGITVAGPLAAGDLTGLGADWGLGIFNAGPITVNSTITAPAGCPVNIFGNSLVINNNITSPAFIGLTGMNGLTNNGAITGNSVSLFGNAMSLTGGTINGGAGGVALGSGGALDVHLGDGAGAYLNLLGVDLQSITSTGNLSFLTDTTDIVVAGVMTPADFANITGDIVLSSNTGQIAVDAGLTSSTPVLLTTNGRISINANDSDAFISAPGVSLALGGDLAFTLSGPYYSYISSDSATTTTINFSNNASKVLFNGSQATATTSNTMGFFYSGAPGTGSPATLGSNLILVGGDANNFVPVVVPPTINQCIADPSLSGCAAVLPTLADCTADPTILGCSVVLPTIADCTADPTIPGCTAVLPTIADCTADPTIPGCTAVLPSLADCTADPTIPGCTAVLPTLAACTADPTIPGCTAVLPTIADCTAEPTIPGCTVVLPTFAACIADPTLPGCSVVLPSIATCTADPTIPGCSAVLPTFAACIADPTLPGCSAVLPSIATCTADPTIPGCTAVLPTFAACLADPTLPGCSAVLPSIADCTADPTIQGCSVVLPSIADCTADPTIQGCSVVLPSIADCTADPTIPGCTAVLPSIADCTTDPTIPGCTVVLPTFADCTANPTIPGCSVVLPTFADCTANPTIPGCSVVLPTLADCTTDPTIPGCTAVLPTIADCTTDPTIPGCSVVLPSLATCTADPSIPGCTAVLPSLADCTAAPATPGCSVVLPSLATCTADPTIPGCAVVLPSLATCTADPTIPGCAVVLPSLATCIAHPTTPGCSVVLPSFATCIAQPTTPGCAAVLPTLAACTVDPNIPGCSVVLPLLAANGTPADIVNTIQSVIVVEPVLPTQTAPLDPQPPASDSNAASGDGNTTEEEEERQAGAPPLDTTANELPLTRQPLFDLSGGGVAGQNMVCR